MNHGTLTMRTLKKLVYFVRRHFIYRWDPRWRFRLIFDAHWAVGRSANRACGYRTDIDKEALSREYVLGRKTAQKGRFLDVGGRDGKLTYLLSGIGPLNWDQKTYAKNFAAFMALYDYYGLDLKPGAPNVLVGDICSPNFIAEKQHLLGSFDVIYSNEVFEHLARPWIAAQNIDALLKPGGLCITIVPFSQRYHEDPADHFRYTPSGITQLFAAAGQYQVCESGFDIRARRYDWQGDGSANDICPEDRFGSWRETWYTVAILKKIG